MRPLWGICIGFLMVAGTRQRKVPHPLPYFLLLKTLGF